MLPHPGGKNKDAARVGHPDFTPKEMLQTVRALVAQPE
jgi:hypothetical protein